MPTDFVRTKFTAGDREWFITRYYMNMTGVGAIISLDWDEAAALRDWLNEELEKRA